MAEVACAVRISSMKVWVWRFSPTISGERDDAHEPNWAPETGRVEASDDEDDRTGTTVDVRAGRLGGTKNVCGVQVLGLDLLAAAVGGREKGDLGGTTGASSCAVAADAGVASTAG